MGIKSYTIYVIFLFIFKLALGFFNYWSCVEPDPSYLQTTVTYLFSIDFPSVCPVPEAIVSRAVNDIMVGVLAKASCTALLYYLRRTYSIDLLNPALPILNFPPTKE